MCTVKSTTRVSVIAIVAILVCCEAGYAQTPIPVAVPAEGINEQRYIRIGGIDQWVDIQGRRRSNPVLLVLHGGPGSTWDPFTTLFDSWEEHFTIVYWSQRGAGRTFQRTGERVAASMTIDRMVEDGIEVAEFVRAYLGPRRVVALGHSWGTVLGVRMVLRRPDLFAAYVGTGQIVSGVKGEQAGYEEVLRRAVAAGRTDAVAELRAIGVPPYDDINKMIVERRWAGVFDTPSDAAFNSQWKNPPEFSVDAAAERQRAWLFSNFVMFGKTRQDGPLMQVDFNSSALRFGVPMIFIQGDADHITPTSLVADYVARISAPKKVLVRLDGGGHNAVFAMRDQFLRVMLREVIRGPAEAGPHVEVN